MLRQIQAVPSTRGMGWVDLNFECSIVCPILPGLMGIWQKQLDKMVITQPRSTSRGDTLYKRCIVMIN